MRIPSIRQQILTVTAPLLALSLCLLVLLECLEIILRYGFATTLIWSADISALLLLLLGWLGAGHLWLARSHLVVNLFTVRLSRFFKWVSIAGDITILLGIIWLTPKLAQVMAIYADIIMPALEVPAAVRFIPLAMGMALITLGATLNLLEAASNQHTPDTAA